MKANELRVGNWLTLQYDPTPFKVTGHFIHAVEDGMDSYSFEGIPLTPEILEKAGFKDEFLNGRFTDGVFYYYDGCIWFDTSEIEIKYLHQLQNLYFALTGEELNIEL